MPSLAALLTQLQNYLLHFGQQNSSKKWATGFVVVITLIWLYQRSHELEALQKSGKHASRSLERATDIQAHTHVDLCCLHANQT